MRQRSVTSYFKPVDIPLGKPKRKFSETFDGIKMLVEHFKSNTNTNKKTED